MMLPTELRRAALLALAEPDPVAKCDAVRGLRAIADNIDTTAALVEPVGIPGRPVRPELVDPHQLSTRGVHTPERRAILLHALAHIEFNAINLALDAIWRFADMPEAYYTDWLKVAEEEVFHYGLLTAYLADMGITYGDFPAHDGLWRMTARTCGDVLARMALVPRTLEARGLDASPPIRAKLAQAGDHRAAEILDVVLRDEIGHVAIGNRWYRHLCAQRGLDPLAEYEILALRFEAPILRGPFNVPARRAAGFTEEELAALVKRAGVGPLPPRAPSAFAAAPSPSAP
ncbi:ferritin-like domain-containing protein [Pigmentiphaga aceris]|uniref:Ferritin-like domain-containing protein n=1 Tax=Pigmentiphaga aceris TaxID=1940612 RepID=A0A5C0AYV0_9BURK|nr:ferritin-like domain-containing protein [Pigmentiphaga aceris]QEI05761.1 ferritin-like domain-containing protein [Pigmentiphaga aceris]